MNKERQIIKVSDVRPGCVLETPDGVRAVMTAETPEDEIIREGIFHLTGLAGKPIRLHGHTLCRLVYDPFEHSRQWLLENGDGQPWF